MVLGASGNLGSEVLSRLADQDVRIRCLVRRPIALPPGAELVIGSLTEPAQLRAALNGVDRIFLIWPLLDSTAAARALEEIALTTARVVYLSSTAIDDALPRQSDPIAQVHADLEALLSRFRLKAVVLRSDTLASNARGWRSQLRISDLVAGPRAAATAVVDERDVAAAAVAILLSDGDSSQPNTPYLLTGPEILSRADQLAQLGSVLDRKLRFQLLDAESARAQLLADGRPQQLVEALIEAATNRPDSTLLTDDLSQLTGRAARTFRAWALDHAAEFS
ncbi:hypothetical protein UM93_16255 [Psychromicrobium lacuslunae]|uniref:NAD(P)-binding domain-containing protein n=1 Tax=Psychromicrobium lacuslunae TaxID=1618207 RepID=A0A0D4C3H3_9MICC|nr:hypothetical protein UM93_16255 [Psychromicrobium lacuslunae]